MNLKDIAVKILNENTWENNPNAAANTSVGAKPTGVLPAAAAPANLYRVGDELALFQKEINDQEATAKKALVDKIKIKLVPKRVGKKIKVTASKGNIGQDREYTITVSNVSISNIAEKYYIVLKATDGKQYYLDSKVDVEILDAGATETPPATILEPTDQGKNSPPLGGIVQPQNFGLGSSRNLS